MRHLSIVELVLSGISGLLHVAASGVDTLHSATEHTVSGLAALRCRHTLHTGLEAFGLCAVTSRASGHEQAGVLTLRGSSRGRSRTLTFTTADNRGRFALITTIDRRGLGNRLKSLGTGDSCHDFVEQGIPFVALALALIRVGIGVCGGVTVLHLSDDSGELGENIFVRDVIHALTGLGELGSQIRKYLCDESRELFFSQFHN